MENNKNEREKRFNAEEVTKQNILRGVEDIEKNSIPLKISQKYDVEVKGKKYPPKEVMRYARKNLDGSAEWGLSGGEPTNYLFQKKGFKIFNKKGEQVEYLKFPFSNWLLFNAPSSYRKQYLGNSVSSISARLEEINQFFKDRDLFTVLNGDPNPLISFLQNNVVNKNKREENEKFSEYDSKKGSGIPKALLMKHYTSFLSNKYSNKMVDSKYTAEDRQKLEKFYNELKNQFSFKDWLILGSAIIRDLNIEFSKYRAVIIRDKEAMLLIGGKPIFSYQEIDGKSVWGFVLNKEFLENHKSSLAVYNFHDFAEPNKENFVLARFYMATLTNLLEEFLNVFYEAVKVNYQNVSNKKLSNWNEEGSTTNNALKHVIFKDENIENWFKDIKEIDLKASRLYKLSMGTFYKTKKFRDKNLINDFLYRSIGVMHEKTGHGQGERFKKEAEVGDYVYVTYGKDRLDGLYQIKSGYEEVDKQLANLIGEEGYISRQLEKIKSPIIEHTRELKSDTRSWMPSGNTTFVELTDLDEANRLLFKPYYDMEFQSDRQISKTADSSKEMDFPLNTILYGPPGTGKTYKLQKEYFDLFTVKETSLNRSQYLENIVADLTWWQVLSIILLDLKKVKVNEIINHELLEIKGKLSNSKTMRPTVWGRLQAHTKIDCLNVNVTDRSQPPIFYKDEESKWNVDEDLLEQYYPEAFIVLDEVKNFIPSADKLIRNYEFVTFHQSFSYEDFIEGIKPKLGEDENDIAYEIQDGIFKKLCLKADVDRDNNYAIFIDEINRGNVSAIFGELITLIEKDKRLDQENELKVKLPYSKKELGVPPNLYIFGTMNTADRSVEALDTALRRRFSFEEIMPIPELLVNIEFDHFNLSDVLTIINNRIEALLDRDHTIGHSYFMSINSGDSEGLKNVFQNNVIPLLQEYFYHDYEKIALILGEGFIEHKESKVKFANFKNIEPPEIDSSFELKTIEDIESAIVILLNKKDEERE